MIVITRHDPGAEEALWISERPGHPIAFAVLENSAGGATQTIRVVSPGFHSHTEALADFQTELGIAAQRRAQSAISVSAKTIRIEFGVA